MKKIALLAILIFIGTAFASYQVAEVYVSDSSGRPIAGATVIFSCIVSRTVFLTPLSWEQQNVPVNTTLKPTDANGVARSPTTVNCKVGMGTEAWATYQGLGGEAAGTWQSGNNTLPIIIKNLSDLTILVQDQDRIPIKDVSVTATPSISGGVSPKTGTTDQNGHVVFKQIPGSTDFILSLKNGDEEKSQQISVGSSDTDFEVAMSTFRLTASVSDDLNNSISGAVVNVTSSSQSSSSLTDASGKVTVSGLKPGAHSITTSYASQRLNSEITMDKDSSKSFVFDIHGPSISEIRVDAKSISERIYVLAKASDVGSGLKEVKMSYSLNRATWIDMPVTLTGSGDYRGSIPPQAKDTQISYKVTASDNAGNKAEEEKEYVVGSGSCPLSTIVLALPFLGLLRFACRRGRDV